MTVATPLTKYGNQLVSPKIDVSPNACYVARMTFTLHHGGIAVVAVDPVSKQHLGDVVHLYTVSGKDQYTADVHIKTQSSSAAQIIVMAANPEQDDTTQFEVSDPKIASCQ